jgi:hypothetical protein
MNLSHTVGKAWCCCFAFVLWGDVVYEVVGEWVSPQMTVELVRLQWNHVASLSDGWVFSNLNFALVLASYSLSAFIDWMKQYVMRMVMYYVQQFLPLQNKQRVKSSMKTKVGPYNNLPLPEIVLCTRQHNLHCANSLSLLWN